MSYMTSSIDLVIYHWPCFLLCSAKTKSEWIDDVGHPTPSIQSDFVLENNKYKKRVIMEWSGRLLGPLWRWNIQYIVLYELHKAEKYPIRWSL